jgi:hypothetical protein
MFSVSSTDNHGCVMTMLEHPWLGTPGLSLILELLVLRCGELEGVS